MTVSQTSSGMCGFPGTGRRSSRTPSRSGSRGDAAPEAGSGGVLLLERDLPRAGMQREHRRRRSTADALAAHGADDEELEHQHRLPRQAPDQAEADGAAVALEEVRAQVRVVLEERPERPRVEETVAIGERAAGSERSCR